MKRIILTGGPASGKTTILENIKTLGVQTLPEIATVVLSNGLYPHPDPWTKEWQLGLQKVVLDIQATMEKNHPEVPVVVQDRGVYDGIAYLMKIGYTFDEAFEWIKENGYLPKYDVVILLPTIAHDKDLYEKLKSTNPERFENAEEAIRIENLLIETYMKVVERGIVKEFIKTNMNLVDKIKIVLKYL